MAPGGFTGAAAREQPDPGLHGHDRLRRHPVEPRAAVRDVVAQPRGILACGPVRRARHSNTHIVVFRPPTAHAPGGALAVPGLGSGRRHRVSIDAERHPCSSAKRARFSAARARRTAFSSWTRSDGLVLRDRRGRHPRSSRAWRRVPARCSSAIRARTLSARTSLATTGSCASWRPARRMTVESDGTGGTDIRGEGPGPSVHLRRPAAQQEAGQRARCRRCRKRGIGAGHASAVRRRPAVPGA